MRPIDEKTKKEFERLKIGLNDDIYDKYLNGLLTFNNLSKILKVKVSYLRYYFERNNIKYRQTVLKETTKHNFFEKIDNELTAYILGYFYADGSIDLNNNRISISQTEKDAYILKLVKNYIGPYYKITHGSYKKNNKNDYVSKPMMCITIHSEKIISDLEKYDITECKTYKPLKNIDFISDDLKIHFIRGYFDGDGTVYSGIVNKKYTLKNGVIKNCQYRNYNWNIISHNKEHLVLIQTYLTKMYKIKSNVINDTKNNFLLSITSKKEFKKMRNALYENAKYFLPRKKEKYMAIPC